MDKKYLEVAPTLTLAQIYASQSQWYQALAICEELLKHKESSEVDDKINEIMQEIYRVIDFESSEIAKYFSFEDAIKFRVLPPEKHALYLKAVEQIKLEDYTYEELDENIEKEETKETFDTEVFSEEEATNSDDTEELDEILTEENLDETIENEDQIFSENVPEQIKEDVSEFEDTPIFESSIESSDNEPIFAHTNSELKDEEEDSEFLSSFDDDVIDKDSNEINEAEIKSNLFEAGDNIDVQDSVDQDSELIFDDELDLTSENNFREVFSDENETDDEPKDLSQKNVDLELSNIEVQDSVDRDSEVMLDDDLEFEEVSETISEDENSENLDFDNIESDFIFDDGVSDDEIEIANSGNQLINDSESKLNLEEIANDFIFDDAPSIDPSVNLEISINELISNLKKLDTDKQIKDITLGELFTLFTHN